jgi:hypothetical protein
MEDINNDNDTNGNNTGSDRDNEGPIIIAGIGSRDLSGVSNTRIDAYRKALTDLMREGAYLHTGGAKGADMMALEIFTGSDYIGAPNNKIRAKVCLPWQNYNSALLSRFSGLYKSEVYNPGLHKEAYLSVDKYHPNPSVLDTWARALHARNYLIVEKAKLVLVLPSTPHVEGRRESGGTYQAVRIVRGINSEGTKIGMMIF